MSSVWLRLNQSWCIFFSRQFPRRSNREDNANFGSVNNSSSLATSSGSPKHFSTFNNNLNNLANATGGSSLNKSGGGSPNLVPNGILKKPPRAPPSSATSTPKRNLQQKHSEARNEAVSIRIFLPSLRRWQFPFFWGIFYYWKSRPSVVFLILIIISPSS